jgi:hypothetical protein
MNCLCSYDIPQWRLYPPIQLLSAIVEPFGYCAPPQLASIMDWLGRTYFHRVVTRRLALTRISSRGDGPFDCPDTIGQTSRESIGGRPWSVPASQRNLSEDDTHMTAYMKSHTCARAQHMLQSIVYCKYVCTHALAYIQAHMHNAYASTYASIYSHRFRGPGVRRLNKASKPHKRRVPAPGNEQAIQNPRITLP